MSKLLPDHTSQSKISMLHQQPARKHISKNNSTYNGSRHILPEQQTHLLQKQRLLKLELLHRNSLMHQHEMRWNCRVWQPRRCSALL